MTFEQAISQNNADPFDTSYAWCYDPLYPYHNSKTAHVLLVDISDPGCFISFGIEPAATVQQFKDYIQGIPWTAQQLPAWTNLADWFVGSAEDLIRQVHQRGWQHDV